MIWVIFFFIIILISSFLAYRSMKDYEEFPDSQSLNALFYIGNPQNLNEATLRKIHDHFTSEKHFFSLEKLTKGAEKAVVLFGQRKMVQDFPELALVEIEDYLAGEPGLSSQPAKTVNVDQTISWLIEPKNVAGRLLNISDELKSFEVENDQKVFIQIILMPSERPGEVNFQTTIRIMVADSDPARRVALAKNINDLMARSTGLKRVDDNYVELRKFQSFKQRSFIPKEVAEFNLTSEEVLDLIA